MRSTFSVDAQVSEVFRVLTSIYFQIPTFSIELGDFFFDYSLYEKVFFWAGKYNLSWGISPNFGFTNLLARIPSDEYRDQYSGYYDRESYIVKADIPFGIGGLQFLAMSRANIKANVMPGWRHIGYGAKYNLAFRWADFDLGFFYHDYMPFRGFLSIKTTIGNTELYNEWLASDILEPEKFSGAVNIGFIHDFFENKLSVNGEFFYNAEGNALWYRPATIIREASPSPFLEGPNLALNLFYRFGGKGRPRIFVQNFYAPLEESIRVIPGFLLSPWPNVDFSVAVQMDLGSKDGYYHKNPDDPVFPDKPRHFIVAVLLSFNGSVRAGY
jgi:hypothetical protein